MKKFKNDNKGFTLVELIVVLVILAILAAILVPALLGYIDEAKNKQLEIHAKSVYTAAQSVASKYYAKNVKPDASDSQKMGGTGDNANDDKYFLYCVEDLSEISKFDGMALLEFCTEGARPEWTLKYVYYEEAGVIVKLDCAKGTFTNSISDSSLTSEASGMPTTKGKIAIKTTTSNNQG